MFFICGGAYNSGLCCFYSCVYVCVNVELSYVAGPAVGPSFTVSY